MMAFRDPEYIIVRMLVGDQFEERGVPRLPPCFLFLMPPSQDTQRRHSGLGDGDVDVDVDAHIEHEALFCSQRCRRGEGEG